MGAVNLALQALPSHCASDPSSLCLGFFGSWVPCASRSSTHISIRGAWPYGGVGGRPSRWLSWGLLSPLPPFGGRGRGGGGGGTVRVLASEGASDSAASPLPVVGVAGSSRSQESFVLAAPSSVASSASAERDCQSRGWGFHRGPLLLLLFTVFSLAWWGVSWSALLCPLVVWWVSCPVLRVALSLHEPFAVSWTRVFSPGLFTLPFCPCAVSGGPGHSLRTSTGLVEFARTLGVTVHGLNECAHALLAVARPGVTVRGHTGPTTGHGISPFSLTVRSQGIGVGSLGGVAVIARRLWLPPGNASTLGRGWSLPLRWRAAPAPAHGFFAGPRQAVSQPVGVPCAAGCGCGLFVFGCWRH